MIKIELDKKEFTTSMESLVGQRFKNFEEIDNRIYNKTGIKVKLDYDEQWNEEERLEGYDYCLKTNTTVNDEDLCYLDVYFIRDNSNQYYITEVSLDFNT